jgi:hypothetical protein
MANAVTATLTIVDRDFLGVANKIALASIAFGNGTDTYPSGGISIGGKEQFGINKQIKAVFVDQAIDGYIYKIDYSNQSNLKLRIYQGDNDANADGPLVELTTSATPAATVVKAMIVGA